MSNILIALTPWSPTIARCAASDADTARLVNARDARPPRTAVAKDSSSVAETSTLRWDLRDRIFDATVYSATGTNWETKVGDYSESPLGWRASTEWGLFERRWYTIGGILTETIEGHPHATDTATVAEYRIKKPESLSLRYCLRDGRETDYARVRFVVQVRSDSGTTTLLDQTLADEDGWHTFQANLASWSDQEVVLRLITDPVGVTWEDWAQWADAVVLAQGVEIPPASRNFGLFVGSRSGLKFDVGGLPSSADQDARALYAALDSYMHFTSVPGVQPVLTFVYEQNVDGAATVASAIDDIAARMGPTDKFVFFYSGHGATGVSEGLPDIQALSVDATSEIRESRLAAWLRTMPATAKKIVILDACYSGGFYWGALDDVENLTFLSAADQFSWAYRYLSGRAIFTSHLVDGLTPVSPGSWATADHDRNGLTFEELFDHAAEGALLGTQQYAGVDLPVSALVPAIGAGPWTKVTMEFHGEDENLGTSTGNHPPVAYAGTDQVVYAPAGGTAQVTLSSLGSFDPDGDQTWHRWHVDGNPASDKSTLLLELRPGRYSISLTVTDGTLVSVPAVATITVEVDDTSEGNGFFTVLPCRLVDTRSSNGPAVFALSRRTFVLTGKCGIPSFATAISLNVTAVGADSSGHVRLYPAETPMVGTSTVNFGVGQTRANNAITPVSLLGAVTAYSGQALGSVHLVIDANGYFR